MRDQTDFTEKPAPQPGSMTTTETTTVASTTVGRLKPDQSMILNVSVRAWLALMVIYTLCYMAVNEIKAEEPFYTISIAVISVFFVQGSKPRTQTQ